MSEQESPQVQLLRERINNDFRYHPNVDNGTAARHEMVREMCKQLAQHLITVVPQGRELSLALTSLEEVMMFANAGIARNQ